MNIPDHSIHGRRSRGGEQRSKAESKSFKINHGLCGRFSRTSFVSLSSEFSALFKWQDEELRNTLHD